jgi:hypothetical protein
MRRAVWASELFADRGRHVDGAMKLNFRMVRSAMGIQKK